MTKERESLTLALEALEAGESGRAEQAIREALATPPLPVQVSLTDDRWKQAAQYWFGQYRQLITGETDSANKVLDEWFNNNFPPLPVQHQPLTDELYNELLFAVGNKYPNETRHQTALRYIQQAETCGSQSAKTEAAHNIGAKP